MQYDEEEDVDLTVPSPQLRSSSHQEEEEAGGQESAPPPTYSPTINGTYDNDDDLGLTFEQEQTADELLADIQNAVDEMLQDFQTSPVSINPPQPPAPSVAPKPAPKTAPKPQPKPKHISTHGADYTIYMKSKNGGFGFQIMGGTDSDHFAQVDYIVPG